MGMPEKRDAAALRLGMRRNHARVQPGDPLAVAVRKINGHARAADGRLAGRFAAPVVIAQHRVNGQIGIGPPELARILIAVPTVDDRVRALPLARGVHLQIVPVRIRKNQEFDGDSPPFVLLLGISV